MPKSKLKIMVKLSDPTNREFIQLTKDILDYSPTADDLQLELMPYFDPDIIFDMHIRNTILKLPYKEKLQVFFNENKYDEVIVAYHDKKKSQKSPTPSEIENSFEFTLQSILCTGFPVGNYYRSMEFYDTSVVKKMIKPNSRNPFWNMAFPSSSCYSYIKSNQKEYTVTGVRWLNDALSHPDYKRVIDFYARFMNEKQNSIEKNSLGKVKQIFMEKLNSFILDIYNNQELWKIKDREESRNRRQYIQSHIRQQETILLEKSLKTIFIEIQDYKNSEFLDLSLNSDIVKSFIDKYENVKETDHNKKQKVQEILLKQLKNIKRDHPALYTDTDNFLNNDEKIKEFRKKLKDLVRKIREKDVDKLNSYNAPFQDKLRSHVKFLKEMLFKEDMFESVLNNIDFYSTRKKEEVIEIEDLMKKVFPNYSGFLKSVADLNDLKEIGNTLWKKEAYKILGRGKHELILKSKKGNPSEKNLFETLAKCHHNNGNCHESISPIAPAFLDVGLDMLKNVNGPQDNENTVTTTLPIYEAYVLLDVVEGKVTGENFKEILCAYSDNLLGNYFVKPKNNVKKNYIAHDTLFVSLNGPLKRVNNSTEKKGGKRKTKKYTRKHRNIKRNSR